MPNVANEDWLVRLRKHLSRKKAKPPEPKVQKPVELELPIAKESCPFPAGSFEKIETMRLRAERGEQVFHPCDNSDILC
ncbi:MAG: hypothetical protein ACK57V_03900 [Pirellula sp.]